MTAEHGYSEDGYILDEHSQEWGTCNACGEEARVDFPCCEDGEVVA